MARKLPGLRRELDAQSLFSVAYGEIASSIYFALGVAMVAITVARGGGVLSVGVVLGLLFVAVGAGRLYLLRK